MKDIIDATLTGSDSPVDGMVREIIFADHRKAYEFTSIDNSLQLVIARNEEGRWERIAGTEPYLSGWVDELAEQVTFTAK